MGDTKFRIWVGVVRALETVRSAWWEIFCYLQDSLDTATGWHNVDEGHGDLLQHYKLRSCFDIDEASNTITSLGQ